MKRILLLFFFSFLFQIIWSSADDSSSAIAQTASSTDGTDFFVSYIKPTLIAPRAVDPVFALVGAYQDDSITISYYDNQGIEQVGKSIFLKARVTQEIQLNQSLLFNLSDSRPVYAACRIRARTPITLQLYSDATTGTELYLALPRPLLGLHYVVASYANNAPMTNDPESRSVFQVVAIKNNTHVHIQLTAPTTVAVPDTIVMQRGQVLQIKAKSPFGDDLTGSVVTADLPVAVIAGHEGAALPGLQGSGEWGSKQDDVQNMLIEEMLPVKDWKSDSLFSIPFQPENRDFIPRDTGDLFRAVAALPVGGSVTSNTAFGITPSTWTGNFYEYPGLTKPLSLTAAQPTALFQYDYYQGREDLTGATVGFISPVLMDIIPEQEWKQEYLWRVPASSVYRGGQLLSIIYNSAAPPTITFEGVGLAWQQRTHTTWQIPGHPELVGLTFSVSSGSYYATADKPFIVYSYGHSEDNYKINAGYASPCGTLGAETVNVTTITVDSLCGAWSGDFIDSQAVAGDETLFQVFSDSSILKRLAVNITSNAQVSIDTIDAKHWSYRISILDLHRLANVSFYLSDDDGLHLIKTLIYHPISLKTVSNASLKRIQINEDTCSELSLVNISSGTSYTVTDVGGLHLGGEFRLTGTVPALPATLKPGDTLRIQVCALTTISDSTIRDTLHLSTDCSDLTYPLSLYAIAPRVNWLEHDTSAELVCGVPDTARLWLVNDNLHDGNEIIYDITLGGPDASEFSIVRNQLGYASLKNFPLDPGERIWFDVAFQPDMTKPSPLLYADRHAVLIARSSLNTTPEVELTARLTHPSLVASVGSIDLGRALIPAAQQQDLLLTNTGDAPLIIRSFQLGNPKITLTGIAAGDTIYPGSSRTVIVTGVSNAPDSIFTELDIEAYEECANPIRIPVSFLSYAPPYHGWHIASNDLTLPPQYLCTNSGAEGTIVNDGTDTVTIRKIELTTDDGSSVPLGITFTNGSLSLLLNQRLAPDSALRFDLRVKFETAGPSTATVRYTWDSAGQTIYSYSKIIIDGLTASTSINVSTPVLQSSPSGTAISTVGSFIQIPILFWTTLPSELGADHVDLTLVFRRDLFRFISVDSRYTQFSPPSQLFDGLGNTILTLHLQTAAGFSAGEAARLNLVVLLARDTESAFNLVNAKFFGSIDTFCVDYTTRSASFVSSDLCGDGILRNVLRGVSPLRLNHVSPNPTANHIDISLTTGTDDQSSAAGRYTFQLLDLMGRVELETTCELSMGPVTKELDIHAITNGTYILRIISEADDRPSDGRVVSQKIEIRR